jgi:competence protein ComEC
LELPDPYVQRASSGIAISGSVLSLEVLDLGRGLAAGIDRWRAAVRERIEATFAPNAIGMAKALVLGENDLTEEEDTAFKASGLAHLLAVSGTHLIFAVLSVVSALRFVLVRIAPLSERFDVSRISSAAGAVLALLYADFAGGSGSAWRAAWMLAAALFVRSCNRRLSALRAVSTSVLVGWCFNPLIAHDISFMLSLAATVGLLTIGRRWDAALGMLPWPRALRLFVRGLSATVSAMLPCSIFLAVLAPSVSVLGVFSNVLAAPFGEAVALPLCLAHALLSGIPAAEQGVAWVASGALLVVRRLALWTAESSWLGVPLPYATAWQYAVLGSAVVGWAAIASGGTACRWRTLASCLVGGVGVACLVVLESCAASIGAGSGRLRFEALDVGQGDAALIDLPDGQLMLVDGGGFVGSPVDPGARVIVPILRARRRARLDVVVLSHPHPDHFGGLTSVIQGVEVGELWDTGQGEAEGAGPQYSRLLAIARARGVRLLRPDELCGRRQLGEVSVEILGPCPDFEAGINPNDNSLVLRIRHGKRAILLTGDAELNQEQKLLAGRNPLRADLLKVGHHGSRTSTSPAFVNRVQPALATISSGMRNRFGHPHPVTLDTLRRAGVRTLRLDRLGAISWSTDGQRMWLRAFESHSGVP